MILSETTSRLERGLRGELSALAVLDRTTRVLLDVVPADVWCGVVLDPSTLLDTGGQHESGFPESSMRRLFEIEHVEQDDVDNLRALTRRSGKVSLLSRSTDGRLDESKYYREILRPLGLTDELRILLRHGPRTWGLLVLCRDAHTRPFSAAELAVAEAVSVPACAALRRSLLLSGVDRGPLPDAPGWVVLDGDLGIRSMSPTAQHWLDQLQEQHAPGRGEGGPYLLRALAVQARGEQAGAGAHVRAPTGTGRWISLRAWPLEQDGEPAVVVSVGPTEPAELTALVLDVYGLSPRAREIAQHVLLGRSTSEIAGHLGVSEYTVQDHLKQVFGKVGVRSRRELVAELFFRHYLPQLAHPPLSTDGRLLSPEHDDQG
ncbi:helix-turn-helix transcriptional regulator [Streptomyces sp. S1A1-8]|uniref:helix-turn-helix transcriptional regulator n=1 Tax=unclassified Streptomyces TaxID=2593676 RepID=UPI001164B4A3|nr:MULTISPECIES: helix-turn-helix transcriptional regulator [unclassified Streptomyces]QDN77697.1 helix-turn-helix transcriptional regulator [Streptomyces sp. S1A1-7]QDN98063.1 helix-turn-helix transcriptional regulator [Streptomyces sp. RLB1-9]QDO19770.1 helix-turn-helix transcriptional regulator [Streptomyces sp. S1A1-8]QDO29895.1 helix-turn-helix transcriptional regulator [Streptomyces sp. S1A1-3]